MTDFSADGGLERPVVGVIGTGATGARAARQLASSPEIGHVLLAPYGERPVGLQAALGDRADIAEPLADTDHARGPVRAVVLAGPAGTHVDAARTAVAQGRHVISTSDSVEDVQALLALDGAAVAAGVSVVVGAGFSPGLSCVLARHVAGWVDQVDEIHVSRFGTGGPACAHQHHDALSSRATDWRNGEFVPRPGGSGRELSVFPDPVGSIDCYRAALPDAWLLQQAFPTADRIAARQAANRRQRLTAWAPMLRRPHPEGRIGAIRVEVRGRRDGGMVTEVVGVIDRPGVAAGAVAGVATRWAVAGRFKPGAFGLATGVAPTGNVTNRSDSAAFLHDLVELGVRAAVFVGST